MGSILYESSISFARKHGLRQQKEALDKAIREPLAYRFPAMGAIHVAASTARPVGQAYNSLVMRTISA
jgi:hypothetical protein